MNRRENVFFALVDPGRSSIGLIRIRQSSGVVERFDDESLSWHELPDSSFVEAVVERRLDPTRGVALARSRGVLHSP